MSDNIPASPAARAIKTPACADTDKREYLLQYRRADEETERLREELARLRCVAERATSSPPGQPPARGTGQGGIQELVCAIDAAERRLARHRRRCALLHGEIEQAISAIPDRRLRQVLRQRYIGGLTWEEVSRQTALELRWVYRLHKRALSALQIGPAMENCPAAPGEVRPGF